ncbi:hypothetical protein RMCBS344292_02050 [Rhizopus microsporus]|nr:hypothetical protein RMCBS344292_02050 [Rhizopus microsporus]
MQYSHFKIQTLNQTLQLIDINVEKHYIKANEMVMNEIQAKEMVGEMYLDKDSAFTYGKLLLLADDRTVLQEMEDNIVYEDVPLVPEDNDSNKALSYKAYGLENIKRFIHLIQEEDGSIAEHAKACFIPHSTTYEILKQWNESGGTVISVGCMKRPFNNNGTLRTNDSKLTQKHTQFLISLVDQNPCITVNTAREQLCNMFQSLSISESGLRKPMKEKIRLFLKIKSRAWYVKGTPAQVKFPTQKGINLSIVGRISPSETINFSKIEPLKPSDVTKIEKEFPIPENKKRKAKTNESFKTKVKKGATAYHM